MLNEENKIEERVMDKIKSGRVRLRSKYVFWAEKLGLGSALALSFLLAVLFFSLFFFYLKASDNLAYFSFGSRGFFVFLESFPYALVAVLVVLVFLAGYLIKKSDWSYKKPFGRWALALAGLIMISGALLAYTKMAEMIENEAFGSRPLGVFFRPFLQPGLNERQFGIAGRVIEVGPDYVKIQTPQGTKTIDLKKIELPPRETLREGMFVMAVGENKGDTFEARLIRPAGGQDLPMIRREIHRRFGPFDSDGAPSPQGTGDFGDRIMTSPPLDFLPNHLNFNGGPASSGCDSFGGGQLFLPGCRDSID